jgi:fermentation-respiration switch protein FrsA (DUF1100 family)
MFDDRVRRLVFACVAAILLAGVAAERVTAFKVDQIMHPARAGDYAMRDDKGRPIPQVTFKTLDGVLLTGWHIRSQNSATVILQHGYRGNSAEMLAAGLMLARHNYGVLFFDFRGHGQSEGDLVTMGLHEVRDTNAAVDYLRQQAGKDPAKIGLLGNSMGGATAILAAANNPQIHALAVEGVFADLKDEVGIGIQLQTPLPASPFDVIFIFFAERQTGIRLGDIAPVDKIGQISPRPILIMQGGNDQRVLSGSGARLLQAAGEPKEYWHQPSAAHVAIYQTAPDEYEQRVLSFFDRHFFATPAR